MTSPTLERSHKVAPAPELRLSSAYYDVAWHPFDGARQMELINPDTEERTGTLISPDADLVSAVIRSQGHTRRRFEWSNPQSLRHLRRIEVDMYRKECPSMGPSDRLCQR
ncbi:MAG: hypothetical protein AAGA71_20375, partial [Pseudomonadota bacterium]